VAGVVLAVGALIKTTSKDPTWSRLLDDLDSNIAALTDAIQTGENMDLSELPAEQIDDFLASLERCRKTRAELLRARAVWDAFVMRQ
jgi:hypothetical protein